MRKLFVLTLLAAVFFKAVAQDVPLNKGWKLAIGDSAQWSSPTYNDQHWAAVNVDQSWE
jgi:hypothetical protein